MKTTIKQELANHILNRKELWIITMTLNMI